MSDKAHYRPLPDWKDETTLVPFSGVQMLDFGFDIDAVTMKSVGFIERTTAQREQGDERTLIPLSGDEELDGDLLRASHPDDEEYSVNKIRALEPFLEKWTPVPVLRIRPSPGVGGREQYDDGPTSWARILVKELPERDAQGHSHRVVLALDTSCEQSPPDGYYLAPSFEDGERSFRFVADPNENAWFLRRAMPDADGVLRDVQAWVGEWIKSQFIELKQAQRPNRPVDESSFPYLFEHWARYLAFLKLLDEAVRFPKIRLIDTLSLDPATKEPRYRPIDVDLVLDIGNSRTCGILIERPPGTVHVDLNDSYVLALRDLSNPVLRYKEPFESRVEFADIRFGERRTPRARAFFWPSLVRVGPEAMRLTRDEEGTETVSGLSSPKRYLWDDAPMPQDWRFHDFVQSPAEPLPLVLRAVQNEVNESGDVLDQVADDEKKKLRKIGEASAAPAMRPRFSRSSTYGLLLAELFLHAFVQINDPAQRETRRQSEIPRRLKRIILTLPSATPMQEQAIMRSRAEGALKLLFKVLKWRPGLAINTAMPEVVVEWDEASCTQAVYLYTEITQKFASQIESFFSLQGRERVRPAPRIASDLPPRKPDPEPSLRVACIDIGGGTTDLMITSYFVDDNTAITPHQDFREGFKVAGDDLVREVVSKVVIPQLARALEQAGLSHADNLMRILFAGDVGDTDVRLRQRRRQYALRVLTPLALHCLQVSEDLAEGQSSGFRIGDVLGWAQSDPASAQSGQSIEAPGGAGTQTEAIQSGAVQVPQGVLDYLDEHLRQRGVMGWQLGTVDLTISRSLMDAVVQEVFQRALSNMCEVIGHLGCDIVLLSGRPSRLPSIRDLVRETMVVAPSRLISMHEYKVGSWYPYRDPITNRIADPKSTAAVGGMVLALAQNRIADFMLFTDQIQMSSTARYIGQLEADNVILNRNILFREDVSARNAAQNPVLNLYAPTFLGFRQLPHERWTTTVLYKLDFANQQVLQRPKPLRVMLEQREVDSDPQSAQEALRAEALKEGIVVMEVEDGAGHGAKRSDVSLRLHTLGRENEYWLDTGVFRLG
ncbi:MAG: virulence factor SrfB [Neomegalonema sp.]|nr:virulence factor SrfB [Neomegalonema sp.]